MQEVNGWEESKRSICYRLDLNEKHIDTMNTKVDLLMTKMITLETRSGLIGLIAGAIPSLIGIIIWLIFGNR